MVDTILAITAIAVGFAAIPFIDARKQADDLTQEQRAKRKAFMSQF